MHFINLRRGRRFGRWEILSRAETPAGKKGAWWNCRCSCGTERPVASAHLRSGRSQSCGCLHLERISKSPEDRITGPMYSLWQSIKTRCYNEKHPTYRNYGGRGVSVCERWRTFEHFRDDMGPKPFEGASIDRIDNSGDYSPENCRWTDRFGQAQNTRRNTMLVWEGVEIPLSEVCRRANVDYYWVYVRCRRKPTAALIEQAKRVAGPFKERRKA